jgi:hypothetical protein
MNASETSFCVSKKCHQPENGISILGRVAHVIFA